MPIPSTEVQTTGTDIALSVTLIGDMKLQILGFKRASAELIAITISFTSPVNGIEYRKQILTSSSKQEIYIDDPIILPEGTIVRIYTSGVTTGQVDAWAVFDDTINQK